MSELDQSIITVGPPKCGKTTLVRAAARQHLQRYPKGIVLVHDVNHQFKDMCQMFETVAAWRLARDAAAQAKQPFPRGAGIWGFGEARHISTCAIELGRAHNSADNVTLPIFVAFDETSMMEDSGSTHIGRDDLRMVTTRRHLGIAPAFNLQRGSALMKAFFEAATDVFVFKQSSEESVRDVEVKLGVPRGSLMCMLSAENFRYAHWKQSQGLV